MPAVDLDAPPSVREVQRGMIGHAMLILLIGLFAGVGLLVSLIGGLEVWPGVLARFEIPGGSDAWVRLHLGQMLNAFLILLVALVLPILDFPPRSERRVARLSVGVGWANTIFYLAALLAPNRALTFGDNRLGSANLASVVGLAPALLFALVSIFVVVVLARQAFRRPL
jgi:hypothetical protein